MDQEVVNVRWRSQASRGEMSVETFCSANLCDASFIFNPNFKVFFSGLKLATEIPVTFSSDVYEPIKGYVWDYPYIPYTFTVYGY